jgi:hypothetical protein
MVTELTVLLDEIAKRRANRDLGKVLSFFDQSLLLFGVKEWPGLVASGSDEAITQWHVESAQMMLELAGRAATILRSPEPTPPMTRSVISPGSR